MQTKTIHIFPDLLVPTNREKSEAGVVRPHLSYWQEARRRFFKNRTAVVSLVGLGLIASFTVLGPFIWPVDPEIQDNYRTSLPPFQRQTAVVADLSENPSDLSNVARSLASEPEREVADLANIELQMVGQPSTLGVKLTWRNPPIDDAIVIYRSDVAPTDRSWGIPIAELSGLASDSSGEHDHLDSQYIDSQSLEAGDYFYTLVARDSSMEERAIAPSLKVLVLAALPLERALLDEPTVKPGDVLPLPLAPLGTDALGRDLLARLMHGGRISLFIGLWASLLYTLLGVAAGGIAGICGGQVDNVIMRVSDFITGLPFLLCVILLKIVMGVGPGESGVTAMVIALVALSWTGVARLVRGQILQLKSSEYVQAARLMGAGSYYIVVHHLLPNILGLLIVSLTFSIPSAIFTEAFLSFIGLGVAAPDSSWGSLCTDVLQSLLTRPHEFFFPAAMISLTVLAFNTLGDGLRDALDPKLRSQE